VKRRDFLGAAAALAAGCSTPGVRLDAPYVVTPYPVVDEMLRLAKVGQPDAADRVRFAVQDLFETDFSSPTVVTLYLFPEMNAKLRPKLLADLRPGARIVSHQFGIAGWTPQDGARVYVGDTIHEVFLWVVPRA
jgi:hypothetical protein